MKSGPAGNVKPPLGLRLNTGKKNHDEMKVKNDVAYFDHRKVLEEETLRHPKVLLTVSSSITNSRKQRPCWRSRSPRSSCSERLMVQTHITSHTHMHICTGNLLNPRSLSIFAAFRRTHEAEGNFETWPPSVNRTALNHMAHEAISPIDYWLSKVANFHLKTPKTPTFSWDWAVLPK